jgi:hypothetical protein
MKSSYRLLIHAEYSHDFPHIRMSLNNGYFYVTLKFVYFKGTVYCSFIYFVYKFLSRKLLFILYTFKIMFISAVKPVKIS